MSRTIAAFLIITLVAASQYASEANAQIPQNQVISAGPDRYVTLDEQLTNRLRAITREQQGYIDFVVQQVRMNKLEFRLIVAIERYAIRRNKQFPFLIFERALKVEAAKRGIAMPPVRQFATSKGRGQ